MRAEGSFWQVLAAARRANLAADGRDAPAPAPGGITRRRVLAALAATSGAALIPRVSRALPRKPRIAIIGGGIAGLTALWHLRAAGVDAHCYEARQRLGGRMFTQRPEGSPVAFEIGGQLVNTEHADIHALARACGIALIDRKGAAHRTMILADGAPLDTAAKADALRPIAAQIGADAEWLDRDYAGAARALDAQSIKSYLDAHADKLPAPWARHLLEATSRTEYGVEPAAVSALGLIWNLPVVDGDHVEVLGKPDERYVLSGGSSALIDAMAERLHPAISTAKQLRAVRDAGDGLALDFYDGSRALADMVIVAVPAPITRQICFATHLPPRWRAFIETMQLGRNEKVQAAVARKVWAGPIGTGGEIWSADPVSGWAQGWDGTVHPAPGDHGVWTWYLGGAETFDGVAPHALAARFAAEAQSGLPGMAAAQGHVMATGWNDDPFTRGAYANYPPGMLTRFGDLFWVEAERPSEQRVPGTDRILFAGEHLSDAYPGYMNGGAQTGRLAAEAILRRLG